MGLHYRVSPIDKDGEYPSTKQRQRQGVRINGKRYFGKETNFDIQKIKNAKELAANDESFQPNFVVKKMYFIGHKTEDVREYYDF